MVTGIGVITPIGLDVPTFWKNVSQGISGAAPVSRFDTSHLPVKIAAEVKGFNLTNYYPDLNEKRFNRTVQYAISAASNAMKDAGLDIDSVDPRRIGVVEGTTVSGADSVMNMHSRYRDKRTYRAVHPYDIVSAYCGEGSSSISLYLGLKGPAMTYCSGCASSNDAIGYALRMIQQDELDVVFAGGSEEVTEMLFAGFCKLRSMSENNDRPAQAARPFDRNRDGFVLGEGSVFLVIEELTHALVRGANIYAEIIGHGRSSEAYHPTDPDPEGLGYQAALVQALREAKVSPYEIDYVNAHGSGTPKNDPIETLSVKKVLGAQAYKIGISASKPVLGHMMGASGAAESAVTILAIKNESMPPTINLTDPDDGCDLDYVLRPRPYPIRTAACLNAGFGGRYSCLVFRRYENGVKNESSKSRRANGVNSRPRGAG